VVGGGIGGLSAALALRRAGWAVTVLERAPELREVGAGIALMANAVRGLSALGVGEALRGRGSAETAGGIRASDGRWLSRVDPDAMTRMLGTAGLGIHRATLHRVLRDALPPEVLRTGAEVVEVDAGAPGAAAEPAEVRYLSGGARVAVPADLVVGADGLHSVVRATHWPDVPAPRYAGSTAWRAVVRWTDPLPVAITWGRGAEFGMMPLGDGTVYWYGAVNAPPGERCLDELADPTRLSDAAYD
jgi:2-polyprenyl-6-methoxyphenol hydroxylase-like FAD-dependent oxidoreductase